MNGTLASGRVAPRRSVQRTGAVAPPLALAIAGFALGSGLAGALDRAGALAFIDLLFDADCAWFLDGFSEGLGTGTAWGPRSVVHPNPANLVNPVLRALSNVCALVGWCDPPASVVRARMALMVAPLSLAVECVFVYLAAHAVFRSARLAAVVGGLNLALLPTLVFGAIPESFALSGCGFAALFYLVGRAATGRPVGGLPWGLVGTFLTGVTVTNIVPFALAYALCVHAPRRGIRSTLTASLGLCGVVAACTAATAAVLAGSFGALGDYGTEFQQLAEVRAPRQQIQEGRWTASAVEQVAIVASRSLLTFPVALGHAVLPPPPSVERLAADQTGASRRNPREAAVRVTYRDRGADWGTFLTVGILLGAVVGVARTRTPAALLFRVAASLLAFHWAFHSVFGVEIFLYSKHWTIPLVMLLAAWLDRGWCRRPIGVAVLGTLGVLAAARSVSALMVILNIAL